MTHEYVVAVGGHIGAVEPEATGPEATGIAWAADRVLAVGSDDVVRAISRGDSTFVDLVGCVVTALPGDLDAASALVGVPGPEIGSGADVARRLVEAGLLSPEAGLEPGSPADLAFWDSQGRLVAVVRAGLFSDGDPKRGLFGSASPR